MQEYRPFDRIEVYREIVETIKKRHILPTETYISVPVVKNRIRKKEEKLLTDFALIIKYFKTDVSRNGNVRFYKYKESSPLISKRGASDYS